MQLYFLAVADADFASSHQMGLYKSIDFVGQGSYGEVHRCKDLKTHAFVALKWIPFKNRREGVPYKVLREISVLRELNHVNVVRLLDVVDLKKGLPLVFGDLGNDVEVLHKRRGLGLVYEDLGIDLARFIKDHPNTTMGRDQRKSFLFQILQGVSYCHLQKVLHRDLKPHNLLVDEDKQTVKLADFGLARTFDVSLPKYSTKVTTLGYRAPEILIGRSKYSSAVDIWSVGCIFAEMVTSEPLFHGNTEKEILLQIFRMFGLPGDRDWPAYFKNYCLEEINPGPKKDLLYYFPDLETEGLDLLSKMLCVDAKTRITAPDALKHPYFRDVQINHLV